MDVETNLPFLVDVGTAGALQIKPLHVIELPVIASELENEMLQRGLVRNIHSFHDRFRVHARINALPENRSIVLRFGALFLVSDIRRRREIWRGSTKARAESARTKRCGCTSNERSLLTSRVYLQIDSDPTNIYSALRIRLHSK